MFVGRRLLIGLVVLGFITSCGGGGGSSSSSGSSGADFGCDGGCAHQHLSSADVTLVLQQAVDGAKVLGVRGTFAVLDRVGNVLAVYQMPGAPATTTINGQIGAQGGLEGVTVPSTIAAISKAGTGAFLSSQGNAFTTRTASQIIQEHFYPGEEKQPAGPLFGVQFSQLICSDLNTLNPEVSGGVSSGSKPRAGGNVGPRPLPLGLSADPGGIPLYKQGDVVGGLGVEFDGSYRLDRDTSDFDSDPEEELALLASTGFEAPSERTGDQIQVGGKTLKYTDASYSDLPALPSELAPFDPSGLVKVTFYTNGAIKDGAAYGSAASGVLETTRAGVPASLLVGASGAPRFPTHKGAALAGGVELQADEVDAILDSAILTAHRARAAIRNPQDSPAQVSIFVVDTQGAVLGMIRTNDGPVFGIDVALQKARTAAFFSSADAGAKLAAIQSRNGVGSFQDYVGAARAFLGSDALTGSHAFTDRANGNLSRPFFPDGIEGNPNGPFSLPFPGTSGSTRSWSPFNDGLQLDLVFQRLVQPLGIPQNPPRSVPDTCTDSGVVGHRLGNGIQIFPGSVPLYRGSVLIGGVGISGDGVDQDDLIAFYGASRPGLDFAGHTTVGDPDLGFNAPRQLRADTIVGPLNNSRLRYVNCPESPFIDDNSQNVCDGL